jgi:regulator of replication initiation timing
MRKALQAEQSKAEMLLKIQNLQEENTDLEDEVDELRRRIDDMLKEEQSDK